MASKKKSARKAANQNSPGKKSASIRRASPAKRPPAKARKPLPSWNDGPSKAAILEFVAKVTKKGAKTFVPSAERIAVFDNDGCLWCEKPLPVQAGFWFGKLGEQAAKDPALRDKQPWKALYEKDHKWLADVITKHYQGDDSDLKLLAGGILGAYAGEDTDSFAAKAEKYLRTQQNTQLKRPYLKTNYVPMRELLRFLESEGFTNYIVSGGGRDFMRPITEELYGIPPERVIGSTVALEYREGNVHHTAKLELFDDGPSKPVRIWSRIGRRPIFAAGNSNGDIPMLEFTAGNKRPSFCLLVNHDDNERDIAYTGGAEKAIEAAKANKWAVASVKNDWNKIFAD
jgi:phosphoserine phosphatase